MVPIILKEYIIGLSCKKWCKLSNDITAKQSSLKTLNTANTTIILSNLPNQTVEPLKTTNSNARIIKFGSFPGSVGSSKILQCQF